MRTRHRVGAGILALTLAAGFTACGDDDDEASTDTTAADASADSAAFCDAVVEFNAAAFEVELTEESTEAEIVGAGELLSPLTQTLVDEAPDDLADAAAEIHGLVTPLLEGDAERFNADASFETYLGFLDGATAACDFDEVEVKARDYAFDAPDAMPAGNVAFSFANTSEGEQHEMVILQKADGVALSWDEILALPEEEGQAKAKLVSVALAGPGEDASTLASLDAGDYVMVCFLPVGGAEDGPPHFTQGMVHEFSVE